MERGVDTAYMVIEEYMLRGRQAAGPEPRTDGRNDMSESGRTAILEPWGSDWNR